MFTFTAVLYLVMSTFGFPSHEQHPSLTWNDQPINSIIAFGDSYTYIQGTPYGLTNYSFIGDLQNLAFTSEQLFESRIEQCQTCTAEGGPNWLQFLTKCAIEKGVHDPKECNVPLWDFAFAGADISEDLLPLHHEFTVSFEMQIEQFVGHGDPALRDIVDKKDAMVVIWIGVNDVNDSKDLEVDFKKFYGSLMERLFGGLMRVYDLGYMRFLVMGLPPLDRAPGYVYPEGATLSAKKKVDLYDAILVQHANAFAKKHYGADVMVFDTNTFLNGIMDRHEDYGIKNVTGYCEAYDQPDVDTDPESYGCLPLQEYFWFNAGHLTSHVHEILAGEVRRFLHAA